MSGSNWWIFIISVAILLHCQAMIAFYCFITALIVELHYLSVEVFLVKMLRIQCESLSRRAWSQRLVYQRIGVPARTAEVRYAHKMTTFDTRVRRVDWYANRYTDTNKRNNWEVQHRRCGTPSANRGLGAPWEASEFWHCVLNIYCNLKDESRIFIVSKFQFEIFRFLRNGGGQSVFLPSVQQKCWNWSNRKNMQDMQSGIHWRSQRKNKWQSCIHVNILLILSSRPGAYI